MLVTYSPAGQPAQNWDFKADKLMSVEAEAIERVTGMNYRTDFAEKLLSGSSLALRALIWVLRKRTEPKLTFGQVDYLVGEADFDYDAAERAAIRQQIIDDPDLSDEDREQLLAAFDEADAADPALTDGGAAVEGAPGGAEGNEDAAHAGA